AAGPGGGPHIRGFRQDGSPFLSFFPYDPRFSGGVNVAVGDVLGDETLEIITGAGSGGGPHVRVFSATGVLQTGFFAYAVGFTGGVNVAVANVDGIGKSEIVTGAGPGGGPHVRIFSGTGEPQGGFFPYDPAFTGGVDVAGGDLGPSVGDEIVTGAGAGGGPHIRVFEPDGSIISSFFAYNTGFTGGVRVATSNVDGSGLLEIVTGPGPGGGPHLRIFTSDGTVSGGGFLFDPSFTGGIDVAGHGDLLGASAYQQDATLRLQRF
ncbi:MAG TPA: hypothetical protein VNA87_03310, partial [Actinomycetota bacterium]|nr:hypothetical protein [Actinomycetota bacterium]